MWLLLSEGCCEEHRHGYIGLLKEVVVEIRELGTEGKRYLKQQSRIYLFLV